MSFYYWVGFQEANNLYISLKFLLWSSSYNNRKQYSRVTKKVSACFNKGGRSERDGATIKNDGYDGEKAGMARKTNYIFQKMLHSGKSQLQELQELFKFKRIQSKESELVDDHILSYVRCPLQLHKCSLNRQDSAQDTLVYWRL